MLSGGRICVFRLLRICRREFVTVHILSLSIIVYILSKNANILVYILSKQEIPFLIDSSKFQFRDEKFWQTFEK